MIESTKFITLQNYEGEDRLFFVYDKIINQKFFYKKKDIKENPLSYIFFKF